MSFGIGFVADLLVHSIRTPKAHELIFEDQIKAFGLDSWRN